MIQSNIAQSFLALTQEKINCLALDIEAIILIKSIFKEIQGLPDFISDQKIIFKQRQEGLKDRFLTFCLKENEDQFLCKRIEKIWQSQQSQLLLPDNRLTLGRSFLEGPINNFVWEAIGEEIEVCLVRRMIDCLEGFEESFDESYILMCSDCYLNLNEISYVKEIFSSEKIPDKEEFQALKKNLLAYITEGKLSNEIDFSLFCNPDLKCFFFEIINEEGKVAGHLLGSIHILPENVAKLPRHIQEAFQAANMFAVEVDMYEKMEIQSIENAISSKKRLFSSHKEAPFRFLDREYILAAKKMNKEVISLESREIANKISDYYKKTKVRSKNLKALYVESMRLGNFDQFKAHCKENIFKDMPKEYLDLVIHSRDKVQASGIDRYLTQYPEKRLFAMVGAAHLPGVIDLLEKKGWCFKQV